MKKSKFSETKIVSILRQQGSGQTVEQICREHGISSGTFYRWKSKYAGMEASDIKRLKELEAENARLKKLYAEAMMDNVMLKDVLSKKW